MDRIDFANRENNGGIGPILGHTQCKYLRALTFPDSLCVGARTTEIRDDRYIMELKIYSHHHEAIAAIGTADMVAFDYKNNKKAMLPLHIRQNIEVLEGRIF
ncbi:MAG: acyl-CoA thioesterase [bacterium]